MAAHRYLLVLPSVAAAAAVVACQTYNMEGVDPKTVVAVETANYIEAQKAPVILIVQDRSGSNEQAMETSIDDEMSRINAVLRSGSNQAHACTL